MVNLNFSFKLLQITTIHPVFESLVSVHFLVNSKIGSYNESEKAGFLFVILMCY
jgi:hypothetical protein